MIMSKLFKKTLFIIIVLFAVIAITIAISSGWNLYQDLTEEYKSKGTAIAKSIAGSSVETILNRDASTVQAMIDIAPTVESIRVLRPLDKDLGHLLTLVWLLQHH